MVNNFDPQNPPADFNVDMGLDWYINELIKQKAEFNELETDVVEQIKKDLHPRIESFINLAILKNVPENKLEEFEKVLDTNDQNKIQEFCTKHIPDLNQIVAIALVNFRDSYLGVAN